MLRSRNDLQIVRISLMPLNNCVMVGAYFLCWRNRKIVRIVKYYVSKQLIAAEGNVLAYLNANSIKLGQYLQKIRTWTHVCHTNRTQILAIYIPVSTCMYIFNCICTDPLTLLKLDWKEEWISTSLQFRKNNSYRSC